MKKFTLIELLVVISIIAILASLLIPGLGRARKAARVGVCISNLSNITKATFMYLDDNDETFSGYYVHGGLGHSNMPMEAFVGTKGEQNGKSLDAQYKMVNPYLGDFTGDDEVPVAHCPLDEAPLNPGFPGNSHYDATGSSYGSNARSNSDLKIGGAIDRDRGVSLNDISTPPAQMVMVIEFNGWHVANNAGAGTNWQSQWHSDNKFGLAFIDGHVKNQKIVLGNISNSNYKLHRDDP